MRNMTVFGTRDRVLSGSFAMPAFFALPIGAEHRVEKQSWIQGMTCPPKSAAVDGARAQVPARLPIPGYLVTDPIGVLPVGNTQRTSVPEP